MKKLTLFSRENKQSSRNLAENASTLMSNNNVDEIVRYGECQRNYAARMGGYAVDGCREFMPSSEDQGSVTALTCAACGCHRNFHRKLGDQVIMRQSTIDSSASSNSSTASNEK